jgi:hypothetical protein
MKSAIPAAAESVYIGRTEERVDTLIVQLQLLKTLHHSVKASIPIIHEVTPRTGE